MATVTGFTAARMLAIENATIVGGHIDSHGNLILETRDGQHILGGYVQGAPGAPGKPGKDGIDVDPIMLDDILNEIKNTQQVITRVGAIAKPVENIQLMTNAALFTPDRRVHTKLYFVWDAVLEDITGKLVQISRYEIWLRKGDEPNYTPYITVPSTEVLLEGLTPEVPYSMSIRAQVKGSTEWGALSIPINFTPVNPPQSPAIPTKPVMETGMGLAIGNWDGKFEEDLIASGFQYLFVEQLKDGVWYLHGVPSTAKGGTTPIRGDVGSEVFIRFRWVDVLNRMSEPSEEASIVIAGVDIGDISEQIEEAMDSVNERLDAALADLMSPVKSIVSEYVLTSDPNTKPSTGWSTTQPVPEAGKYIWTRTVITNLDGSVETSIPAIIGSTATRNLQSALFSYAITTDGKTPPTTGWDSALKTTSAEGEFQWIRVVVKWTDSTETETFTVNKHNFNWTSATAIASMTPYYYVQSANGVKPKKPADNSTLLAPWTLTRPGPVTSVDVYRTEQLMFTNGKSQYTAITKLVKDPDAVAATNVANLAEAKAAGLIKSSVTDPGHDPGRIWLVLNASGQMVGIKVSDGTNWASYTIVADEILVPSSIGTVSISNGAIVGSKISLVDFTNYFLDPTWTDTGFTFANWTKIPNVGIEKNGTGTVTGGTAPSMKMPVNPGDKIRFSAKKEVLAGTVAGTTELYMTRYGKDKVSVGSAVALTMTAGGNYTEVYTVPAGTYFLAPGFRTNADTPSATKIRISDVDIRMMVGTLIEPGSISTPQLRVQEIWASEVWLNVLRAGVIEASMVTAGFGDSLNLQSNGTINAIIETQVDLSNTVSDAQNAASDAQNAASDALSAAGNASADAQTVQTNLDATNSTVNATKTNVDTLRLWFRVDSAGAHIGRTGSKFQTHIKPDRFEITENDIVTTYWESGRMVVKEAVVDVITLSGHSFEPYGTNGTVVKVAT